MKDTVQIIVWYQFLQNTILKPFIVDTVLYTYGSRIDPYEISLPTKLPLFSTLKVCFMIKLKILVVEDEDQIRRALETMLQDEGYEVFGASSLKEGKIECACRAPDLVIIDLGLPDGDGLNLISEFRAYSSNPILVLSARDNDQSKVTALDLGADDYLSKPFSSSELKARIRALLRRFNNNNANKENNNVVKLGNNVLVNLSDYSVYKNDQKVHLTKLEFKLLQVMLKDPNKVLTQRHLMLNVWGAAYVEHPHYLRIYMNHLRIKLEDNPANPEFLITETGVGYRLVVD